MIHKFTSFSLFLWVLFHQWCIFKLVINSIWYQSWTRSEFIQVWYALKFSSSIVFFNLLFIDFLMLLLVQLEIYLLYFLLNLALSSSSPGFNFFNVLKPWFSVLVFIIEIEIFNLRVSIQFLFLTILGLFHSQFTVFCCGSIKIIIASWSFHYRHT